MWHELRRRRGAGLAHRRHSEALEAGVDRVVAGGRNVVIVLGRDFTDVGHAVALGLGMLVSTRFGEAAQWSRAAVALLGVGAPFGFLLLANGGPYLATVTVCGLLGAAVFGVVVSRTTHGYAIEASSGHRL
jgi:hypothetical protein